MSCLAVLLVTCCLFCVVTIVYVFVTVKVYFISVNKLLIKYTVVHDRDCLGIFASP